MSATLKVLIASNNAHKHQELTEIFAIHRPGISLVLPRELGLRLNPVEDSHDYIGNARIKARAFYGVLQASPALRALGLHVLADDSGLEVDALGGRPGLQSAPYHQAAPNGDGCSALLRELAGMLAAERSAHFRAVLVWVTPSGLELDALGLCEGRIAGEKRGQGGFGFDPVFLLKDDAEPYSRCMAELPQREKNRISHRGRSVSALVSKLNSIVT